MKEAQIKRITRLELMENPTIQTMLEAKAWHLLGINVTEEIEVFDDIETGDLIIRYR